MTPQEIIKEIQKLPPMQQKEVVDSIFPDLSESDSISEEEAAKLLLVSGIIKEIPEGWNLPDEDFEPIEIKGNSLSETIIEARR